MPSSRSVRFRYLCCFLLFSLLFAIIILGMIALGEKIKNDTRPSTHTDSPLSAPIIVIDAGHGGEDGGAIGNNGVLEKDLNLEIAKILDEMLRSAGYQTVMTRVDDRMLYDRNVDYHGRKKRLDLEARLAIAQAQENAIFVSIHMNAFPASQYSGLQVYYSTNHQDSALLAEQIQADTKKLLLPNNERHIKPSAGTSYLLDGCTHPAVLVECGFLSNPEECQRLATQSYQRQLATVLFGSLTDFYKNYENARESVTNS